MRTGMTIGLALLEPLPGKPFEEDKLLLLCNQMLQW